MKKTLISLMAVLFVLLTPSQAFADGSTEEVNCREVYGQGTVCDKVHEPEDTAIGGSAYILIFGSFAVAMTSYFLSRKAEV
ncbi:hypothetical protein ACFL1M_03705 [Patescibacteria group bacterium]